MTEQYLIEYNAELHSDEMPQYTGSHIVEARIPLTEVTFDPADDEATLLRGSQSIATCPHLGVLEAVASNPQITAGERRQRLTVACPQRRQVAVSDRIITQGVCAIKADADNIPLGHVPNQLLLENIRCPFDNLGARVVAGEVEVPVTVNAQWRPDLPRSIGRIPEIKT